MLLPPTVEPRYRFGPGGRVIAMFDPPARARHPRRAASAVVLGLTVLLFALSFLAGCGLHAQTDPYRLDLCAFYCRQTHCPGQPIPPQLAELRQRAPEPSTPPPCDTIEVGPKGLAETLSALGTAVLAFFTHGIL